jgi:hypothetical protein
MRARQHNLNVGVIATETVRMVLEQAFLVSSYHVQVQGPADWTGHPFLIASSARRRFARYWSRRARCLPHPIGRVVDVPPGDCR